MEKSPSVQPGAGVELLRQSGAVLGTFIETFGWPGTVIILGYLFTVWYARPDQKQAIIDVYILGKGLSPVWPFLVVSGVFLCVSFAQRLRYNRKVKAMQDRMDDIAKQKSALQERLTGGPLSHGGPPQT